MAGWNEQTVSVAEEIKFMYYMSKKGFMQTRLFYRLQRIPFLDISNNIINLLLFNQIYINYNFVAIPT